MQKGGEAKKMNVKYVAFTGKHPAGKKEDRNYTDKPPRRGIMGQLMTISI